MDSLDAAVALGCRKGKRVAVLIFGSQHRPGGGARSGRGSLQDEWACYRAPALLAGLEETRNQRVRAGRGPGRNKEQGARWLAFGDAVCVPSVPIMRDARLGLLDVSGGADCFDAIYMAAEKNPKLREIEVRGRKTLVFEDPAEADKLREAARSQMFLARSMGARVLILGAWGCGNYGNPPEIVAQSVLDVLRADATFHDCFDAIHFAVLSERDPNFEPFAHRVRAFNEKNAARLRPAAAAQ